ncbi:MAG: hypothetical protein CFH18_00899 [Alphaproteobacteria bacterium MarineAlpha5_Bin8]|nr:MAG: hypothetical protein CFH17_01017 [Alphaproteobacteria bacterium MarineAlpha5_Bin7]PPR44938.1 MAG: hypothetical protein CFH18_00899 [Alphaproteobacteria bacterium MarineAlpha5_Bin8]PPR53287.1 MAG: hypothetical protein CFH16_01093 [Alphaproteobacteria bacterium MarineAlpha5_Bin6]|tara:strand:+ start:1401 stop:3248 length:1848 start_codon:yes stop_codon:yes gene_type:complete
MFRTIGKSKIAILLAILFGISLFFFRGGSRYSNIFNSDNVVANISGTQVSTTKFNRTLQMNINQFNQMLGQKMTGDEIRSLQIHSLALGALINDAVFENEYDNKKFILDESIIAIKTKEKIPQLYDKSNKLNDAFLNQFLQQQQLKIEDIVQIINFETRNELFNETFFNINYPKIFNDKILQYDNHKRKVQYLEISLDNINLDSILNDSNFDIEKALQNYYQENTMQYMSKEERNVEYIIVNKNDYINEFSPTDFEIKEYFDENKNLFFENERRSFIQFNFKDLNDAKTFKDNIYIYDSVEEIKNYASQNNIEYNIFGDLYYEDMLDEIAKVLFSLDLNQKSEIIETTLAKHLIVLTNIKPAAEAELNNVRDEIYNSITEVETKNFFEDLKENINQSILDGQSLQELSKNWGLNNIKNVKKLSKDFKNYEEKEKDFYKSLISNSFSANKDFISDIINLDSDTFYIFNVTKIEPSKIIEYSAIKDNVEKDWQIAKKISEMEKKLLENKENINLLNEFKNIYNSEIYELEVSKNSDILPRNLINKIFEEKKYSNIQAYNNNKIFVANINDIIIDNSKESQNSTTLLNDIRGSFGNELMQNVKISTNDNLINAIINRY